MAGRDVWPGARSRAPLAAAGPSTEATALGCMYADSARIRFVGDGSTLKPGGEWSTLARLAGHWALRGVPHVAVTDRASGDLLGRVGSPSRWADQASRRGE
jgi:hypothetical protein